MIAVYQVIEETLSNTMYYLTLLCVSLLFLSATAVEYKVTLLTSAGVQDATISIELTGVFGRSRAEQLGTGNFFQNAGIHGPISVNLAQSLGDILSFKLTFSSQTTSSITITQVLIAYTGRVRTYLADNIVLTPLQSAERSFPTSLTKPKVTFDSTIPTSTPVEINSGGHHNLRVPTTDDVNYAWYSHRTQQYKLISNTSQYNITNANGGDAASYFCVLSLGVNIVKTDELEIVVNFADVLPFSVTIIGAPYVQEGNDLQIQCQAISYPANPTIGWYKGAEYLPSSNGVLSFTKISRNQSGDYACKANSSKSQDERTIAVQVNYLDTPKINTTAKYNLTVYVKKGEKLSVTCLAEGYPKVSYAFFDDNNNSLPLESNSNTVTLKEPKTGRYSCRASNLYFTRTQSIFINATTTTSPPSADNVDDDDDFWTTTIIIMFAVAGAFLLIIVILIICLCVLCRKKKTPKSETMSYHSQPQFHLNNEAKNISYHPNNQHKHYNEEQQPSGKTMGNINRLSISSDEYKSSETGLSVGTHKNGTLRAMRNENKLAANNVRERSVDGYQTKIDGMDVEYC